MKKILLTLILAVMTTGSIWSQCVQSTCSTYVAIPITYTTFPTAGTSLPLGDDQMSGTINLGFNFDFYCNTYSQADVSSNGFLTFDLNTGNSACCSGLSLPSAASPNNMIDLFWNDLYPPGGGSITYTTIGTAPNRMFILTFTMIPHCCSSGPPDNSGQIVLYETSNVIDIYSGNVTSDGSTCTQGIENFGGSIGLPVPGRNGVTWTTTNTAYRFTRIVPTPPTAIIGASTSCIGTQQVFSILPSSGATSYVWTLPGGWTGTSTTTAITSTVGSSGTISVAAVYTCGTSAPVALNYSTIPSPVVSILSATPNLVCSGNPVTVNTSGAINYTLQPGNYTIGPPFIVTPMANTVYSLVGVDANGCISLNNPTITVYANPTPTVTVNSGAVCLGKSFTITPSGADSYTLSSGFSVVTPAVAGVQNYTVVGTSTNGCTGAPAISTLTVFPLPNVVAASTRTDMCRNETTTITANGATSYSWSTGATTQAIPVSPLNTTVYVVTGVDANNCAKSNSITIKVSFCVGISENGEAAKDLLSVYPNPSGGEFTIKTKAATTVMIYDMQGKLIYDQKLAEGQHLVNLSQFASGEYILKAYQGESKQTVTLIKQ